MNRHIVTLATALIFALAAPLGTAHAQQPTPTPAPGPSPADLENAKKAFAEGKALYEAKKLTEAAQKFLESYKLSKNPVLLYNVALALDEAKQRDKALSYYRKFLSDAPADAAQRQAAVDRVKVLEEEALNADLTGPTNPPPNTDTQPTHTGPIKIKPAGTYGPNDFQHQVVDVAPPGKPLDISAFVPEDSGFVVTLYYRGSGDAKFTAKEMKWRYKELVGRIPAQKIAGSSIQYYIEVKDQAGTVITRSGKSTSPNLVDVEAGAPPRFYPDLTDEGTEVSQGEVKRHDEENPLGGRNDQIHEEEHVDRPVVPAGPKNGFLDVGSTKFRYTKWGSTYAAAGLIGVAITFNILARNQASALQDDVSNCPMNAAPPCRAYDSYDRDLQKAGKRDQTIANVSLGIGIAATAVAGFYWYKELTGHRHAETVTSKNKNKAPEMTWVVAPAVGDGFTGAAAAARF